MDTNEVLSYITIPQPTNVAYLSSLDVTVGLRNSSPWPLILEELVLIFRAAHSSVPEAMIRCPHRCRSTVRVPGEMFEERVHVKPTLVWAPHTNEYRIEATYRVKRDDQFSGAITAMVQNNPHGRYLILDAASVMPGKTGENASVFISFKDEEDWPLAQIARDLLPIAGFVPYLAREDIRVGCDDFWENKIYPEIRRAEGTLVLWTPNTVAKPDAVLEEIRYSQEVGTPDGLFLQKGTALPTSYPGSRREYKAFARDEAFTEFARAIEACARHWRESGRFF